MNFNEIKSVPAKSHNEDFNVKGELKFIPANSEKGFNFDYVLYIPDTINSNTTLIVEGANTSSRASADLAITIASVIKDATGCNLPIYNEASRLGMPLLYPIFPRWVNGEESIYNHMLSSNSLDPKTKKIKESGLERVDLQLIKMIEDAKEKFVRNGIKIDDKIIIDGYSASSKFANRFTLLHPEIVKMCIGGGFSGQLTLPVEKINGEKLIWPIGIGNLEELIGEKLTTQKIEIFKKVPQFYYIGKEDNTNDPFKAIIKNGEMVPENPSIIRPREVKQLCKYVGLEIKDRVPKIMELYNQLGINSLFKVYKNADHHTCLEYVAKDLSDFIDENLEKEHNFVK